MNFSELPLELIDEILKHLDAISLARSRQVCHTWRALHLQPKYKQLWRQACMRDIGHDGLIELTGDRTVFTDDDLRLSGAPSKDGQKEISNIDWQAIYQGWFRSRHIGKWPFMTIELKGHSGQVLDVKFSGDRVVTCGDDSTIRVWDGWTGLWQNPSDIPHDLLASGSRDCSVKVWDMRDLSGVAMVTCHGHTGPVNCVAFGENSSFVASASDDCSVRIWLVSTGHCTCYYTLSNLSDWVEYARFWGSDTLLYVTDQCQLALLSIPDKKTVSSVKLTETNGDNFTPLPPGVQGALLRGLTALVLTTADGLFVWENKSTDSLVHNFPIVGPHSTGIERGSCLAMHGALVAIGTRLTGAVYVYHLDGEWENQFRKVHCVLQVNKSSVTAIAIEDDGQGPCLAAGGDDGIVKVYRWFPPMC